MDRVIEHPFVAFLKRTYLGHVGHVRLYARAELETMLRPLGFEPRFHFRIVLFEVDQDQRD